MTDVPLDLAGVSPSKLAEARRRAAVVADYARLDLPTRALAEQRARELNIGLRLFYDLVRIFRETGSLAPRDDGRRSRPSRIDPRIDEAVSDAVKAASPHAKLSEVIAAANTRCSALGLPNPSARVVRARLMKARAAHPSAMSGADLIVDKAPLALNVVGESGATAAWVTCVLHAPTASILGHYVSGGSAGARDVALALLDALAADQREARVAPVQTITMVRPGGPEWTALADIIEGAGMPIVGCPPSFSRPGSALMALLGEGIGRINFRPRLGAHRPARDGGEPVELSMARGAVRAAIAHRNRADVRVITDEGVAFALARRLAMFVRSA